MNKNKYWNKIIANTSELGAGTKGASLGLQALQAVDNSFLDSSEIELIKNPDKNFGTDGLQKIKRLNSIVKANKKTCQSVAKTLQNHDRILLLTGDHSNAIGGIAGLKKFAQEKTIGVIWIDAHADLHIPDSSPSGNIHGMPLGACLDDGNKKHSEDWEEIINLSGYCPALRAENIEFIGIRDLEAIEWQIIQNKKIRYTKVEEARKIGVNRLAESCLKNLDSTDFIYLSFDVDVLDPSISKGTGTPVFGGFSAHEVGQMLHVFLQSQKVKVLEITEINPLLDNENRMAKTVNEIMSNL
tara:strand:+ start:2321 stop:3217 length:897 start_codon:yes stop_codon:yes gene_type:complete